jgi:hypothetical protein
MIDLIVNYILSYNSLTQIYLTKWIKWKNDRKKIFNQIILIKLSIGKPSPSVIWFHGNILIDESYTTGPHGLVRNELNLRNLNRTDFMSILTCRASNTNLSEPVSSSVVLDMNCKFIFFYRQSKYGLHIRSWEKITRKKWNSVIKLHDKELSSFAININPNKLF